MATAVLAMDVISINNIGKLKIKAHKTAVACNITDWIKQIPLPGNEPVWWPTMSKRATLKIPQENMYRYQVDTRRIRVENQAVRKTIESDITARKQSASKAIIKLSWLPSVPVSALVQIMSKAKKPWGNQKLEAEEDGTINRFQKLNSSTSPCVHQIVSTEMV